MLIDQDVTIEYINNATPKTGRILYENKYNYDCHDDEINMAEWIYNTFGGNIILLSENNKPYGEKYPDYEWNSKYWELKTLKSEHSIDSAMRKAITQIYENPGGVILDFGRSSINLKKVENAIRDRLESNCRFKIDIMIVINSQLKKVIRYKK